MLRPYLPLITALGTLSLITTFALMNRTEVAVWVFGLRWWMPLVAVILLSFVFGVVVGLAASLRRQFYLAGRLRDLEMARQATAAAVAPPREVILPETDAAVEEKAGEAMVVAHE